MIEILMLLGVIAIWFVLGIVSSYIAFYILGNEFGKVRYKVINITGRKKSTKRALTLLLVMGPSIGIAIYYMVRNMIEMHQGKIYLEEV